MKKKHQTIGLFIPNASDPTSYWRAVGPLSHLRRYFLPNVEFKVMPREVQWNDLAWLDGVFIQRPNSAKANVLCHTLEEMKIPIWMDFDDDMFNIPAGNPAFEVFANPETRQNIERLIKRANVVTVSTPALRKLYGYLNKNISVIPNAWNFEEFPDSKRMRDQIPIYNQTVIWRGSRTHDDDLMLHLEPLYQVFSENPEWKLTFVGAPLMFVVKTLMKQMTKRCASMPALPIYQFLHFMNHLQPSVAIVPLEKCVFNEGKSNIAWQEFSYAGSTVVAPEFGEWRRPGIQTFKTPEDLYRVLSETMKKPKEELRTINDQSWQDIRDNFNLARVNRLRAGVISKLLNLDEGNYATDTEDRLESSKEVSTLRGRDDEKGSTLSPSKEHQRHEQKIQGANP